MKVLEDRNLSRTGGLLALPNSQANMVQEIISTVAPGKPSSYTKTRCIIFTLDMCKHGRRPQGVTEERLDVLQ